MIFDENFIPSVIAAGALIVLGYFAIMPIYKLVMFAINH
jgi:hypothetical protein